MKKAAGYRPGDVHPAFGAVFPKAVASAEVRAAPAPRVASLDEANEIVSGDRQKFYGHPLDNHGNTADFWNAYIGRKYRGNAPQLTAEDVCWMMVLLKISREANRSKQDNIVDVCGYAANVEMITTERALRERK